MRRCGRKWEKEYSRQVEAVDWSIYKDRNAIDQKVVCLLTAILNDQEDEIDRLYGVIDRLVRKMRGCMSKSDESESYKKWYGEHGKYLAPYPSVRDAFMGGYYSGKRDSFNTFSRFHDKGLQNIKALEYVIKRFETDGVYYELGKKLKKVLSGKRVDWE